MPKKKTNKKRLTPKEKIKQNIPWRVPFIPDKEVAEKIIEEYENSPNGAEFNIIINNNMRKAYDLPKK